MDEILKEISKVKNQLSSTEALLHQLIREARKQGASLRAIGEASGYSHEGIRKMLEEA
tara:strand:+ start:650 stop:823 length:174 start_codon:yes stop_codon:yes gene_type:complete